jgi:hypothetical protein
MIGAILGFIITSILIASFCNWGNFPFKGKGWEKRRLREWAEEDGIDIRSYDDLFTYYSGANDVPSE